MFATAVVALFAAVIAAFVAFINCVICSFIAFIRPSIRAMVMIGSSAIGICCWGSSISEAVDTVREDRVGEGDR